MMQFEEMPQDSHRYVIPANRIGYVIKVQLRVRARFLILSLIFATTL